MTRINPSKKIKKIDSLGLDLYLNEKFELAI